MFHTGFLHAQAK
jgi:hypothetical protein